MADRYRFWLGAGVVAGGVSAAMLAGAGTAAAEGAAQTASDTEKASISDSGASKAAPDSQRPSGSPQNSSSSGSADTDEADTGDTDTDEADTDDVDTDEANTDEADTDDVDGEDSGETTDGAPAGGDVDKDVADTETQDDEATTNDKASDADRDTSGPERHEPVSEPPDAVADDEAQAGAAEPEPVEEPVDSTSSTPSVTAETPADTATDVLPVTDETMVIRAAATESATAAPTMSSKWPDILNGIGGPVYDFYAYLVDLFAGPARAPWGSSVRVGNSTLTIGPGVEVPVDWYFPDTDAPTGLIYFQHGFLATSAFYSATAAELAERTNSIVVAPTLTWNVFDVAKYPLMLTETHEAIAALFVGQRDALVASALAAGYRGELPSKLVLSGHSAGGGLAVGAARYLVEMGGAGYLMGVVMFDGVGYDGQIGEDLPKIPRSIPVYDLAGKPYGWNDDGDAANRLAAARPGQFIGVVVSGGTHADAMQSSNGLLQMITNSAIGYAWPWTISANEVLGAGWINDMLNGTHTSALYGTGGAQLRVSIGWWLLSPTAKVLGNGRGQWSTYGAVSGCPVDVMSGNCTDLPEPDTDRNVILDFQPVARTMKT